MVNIEEDLKKIRKFDGEYVKTKDLLALGLTNHRIKVCVERGYIKKRVHGEYMISVKDKEETIDRESTLITLRKFKNLILEKKYQEAYITLKHLCEDKITDDFDKNIYIYFNLLKMILGNNYDYECMQNLNVKNIEFNDYENLIINGEITAAKEKLDDAIVKTLESPKIDNSDILIVYSLFKEVESNLNNGKNIALRKKMASKFYSYFISNCREINHHAALTNLNKCISFTDDEKQVATLNLMKEIVETILVAVKTKEPVCITRGNYPVVTSEIAAFSEAIYNHDFLYALFLIQNYRLDDKKKYRTFFYLINRLLYITGEIREYEKFCESIQKENAIAEELNVESEVVNLVSIEPEIIVAENREPQVLEETEPEKDKIETEAIIPEEKEVQEDNYTANTRYKLFLAFFEKGDYETALPYLAEFASTPGSNEYNIYNMLQTYLDMKRIKQGFNHYDYSYDNLSTKEIFYEALKNKDYQVAFKNIGKLTYQSDDESLNIMKAILHEMFNLERMYGQKKQADEGVREVKKEEKQVEHFVNYTYNELFNAVACKEEKLYDRLELGFKENKLSRCEYTTFRLLTILRLLKEGKLKTTNEPFTDVSNYFKCLLEAIKFQRIADIEYFYNIAYEKTYDKSDLEIYGIILKEIIDEQKHQEEIQMKKEQEKREQGRIAKVNRQIRILLGIGKETLTDEELEQLFDLIYEKTKNGKESEEAHIEINLLGIIETLIYNPEINNDYFGSFEKIVINNDEDVKELLLTGNFSEVSEYLKKVGTQEFLKSYSTDNRMIIITLLQIFEKLVNQVMERPIITKEEEPFKTEVKNISSRLKHHDFLGAFELVLKSENIQSDVLSEIAGNVLASYLAYANAEKDISATFEEAFNNLDINEARIALINYKELLDLTSFGKVDSYSEKYKEMNKKYLDKRLK